VSDDREGEGFILMRQGRKAYFDSEPQDALVHFQRALEWFQKSNEKEAVIDCLNGMSWSYRDLGQISKSQQIAERALTASRSIKYLHGEAQALIRYTRIGPSMRSPWNCLARL
jgi:tetratricopeptide (TPR) repeat protein